MEDFKRDGAEFGSEAPETGKLIHVITLERLRACASATETAEGLLKLHQRNIEISEALYPTLHMLEIVTRNQIHAAFSAHFGTNQWYDGSWMKGAHANLVQQAKAKIAGRGEQVAPGAVVSAMTFGFWCAMFGGGYECRNGPWPAALRDVAPAVPRAHRTRARVGERLEQARALRNRVFHHVPVVQRTDLYDKHRALVELLGWLSPDARAHLGGVCRFRAIVAEKD
ncbi:hypothetical protein L2Y96_02910 [Luteibacter aegosomaticola]|uniref:hypothetical protein n=1 Tax=Luteibacter aegosomaticola TaxID=2911538 RepID=UPI001FFA5585|nr:hypothetical protein [Luteibacter aegosomaticola]UPG90740.1 hypothetical protein L2Y96_02910 [Luteibacter aegosomaticola]